MSSSTHANNKIRSILVLGTDFIQGIDNTTVYGEKMYSPNFTVDNKKFCNGDSSYLFVNGKEIINFKAKDSEITPYPLCLGGLSKDFYVDYMRATELSGYVYDFSIDYWAITHGKILDIHKYLMKENNMV